MSSPEEVAAWLERPDGSRFPIQGSCSIGRSPTNQVVLVDEKVSRRHALVHAQERHEYWLVDLGSSNGTYLEGRRLIQPTRLRDGETLKIGDFLLQFRQPNHPVGRQPATVSDETIHDIRTVSCWLLVADIEGSTQMVRKVESDHVAMPGVWLAECKQLIEECGGSINKFLGDGFFAYWHELERTPNLVARALEGLKRMQEHAQPSFRVVVHYGRVFTGGGGSLGEESLLGSEVNFVFRMEKLAAGLCEPRLLSEPAWSRLAGSLPAATDVGKHALPGFDGTFPFYSF